MLSPTVRALVLVAGLWCIAGAAQADVADVTTAGVSVGRVASHAIEPGPNAAPRARAAFHTRTAGLRTRLKLRLRFDWIRSYSALGPHLYLADSRLRHDAALARGDAAGSCG